jgi:hypothetical protein
MALRNEHGKLRPQPPRAKDLPRPKRTRQRSRNQDGSGRFVAGNDAAKGKRLKAIIRRHLGRDVTGSEHVERVYAETVDVYRACLRTLGGGATVPQVQDTVARRARWSVLSAHYSLRAVELGLGTEAGDAALEMALKLDARAERLDVTAIDLAERLGAEQGASDPHADLAKLFELERARLEERRLARESAEAAAQLPPSKEFDK